MPLALSSVPRSRAFDRETLVLARDRDKDPIAADVEEAYRESDLPPARARERADRAQENADRSGQPGESPREEEKGVGALEERDGG